MGKKSGGRGLVLVIFVRFDWILSESSLSSFFFSRAVALRGCFLRNLRVWIS